MKLYTTIEVNEEEVEVVVTFCATGYGVEYVEIDTICDINGNDLNLNPDDFDHLYEECSEFWGDVTIDGELY